MIYFEERYKAIRFDYGGGGLVVDRWTGLTRWDLPKFADFERAKEYVDQLNLVDSKELEKIILGEE